jgi:hypothetical protein
MLPIASTHECIAGKKQSNCHYFLNKLYNKIIVAWLSEGTLDVYLKYLSIF